LDNEEDFIFFPMKRIDFIGLLLSLLSESKDASSDDEWKLSFITRSFHLYRLGWRKNCNCDANLLKGSNFSQFRYRLTIISALKIMSIVTQIENHWLTHPYLIIILHYYDLVK
jgi:hypothetical protein